MARLEVLVLRLVTHIELELGETRTSHGENDVNKRKVIK